MKAFRLDQKFILGFSDLPTKGEYHDNFNAARATSAGRRLDRAQQPSLFDRIDWSEQLHRLALATKRPLLVRAHRGEAEVWMSLMQHNRGHHVALANWYSFLWRPVFSGADDEDMRLSLIRHLAQYVRGLTRRLTLAPVPDEDGSARRIAAAFASAGWQVVMSECDENCYVRLEGRSFEAFWSKRPGRLRNTVKRKSKSGVVSTRIECAFNEGSWRDYEQVYARSWKPSEGSPAFLKALARQESAAGSLRLGIAHIDGNPVAAQFWTVENKVALIHKLAHDERHIGASPGTLLTVALFEHVIDVDKVEEIDFGTGNDAYKRDWMEQTRPRFRIDLLWPGHVANWPVMVRNHIRHLNSSFA